MPLGCRLLYEPNAQYADDDEAAGHNHLCRKAVRDITDIPGNDRLAMFYDLLAGFVQQVCCLLPWPENTQGSENEPCEQGDGLVMKLFQYPGQKMRKSYQPGYRT